MWLHYLVRYLTPFSLTVVNCKVFRATAYMWAAVTRFLCTLDQCCSNVHRATDGAWIAIGRIERACAIISHKTLNSA